ncbi:MAG: beta-ketoacyl synthase [Chitinophagaceae bacterium]|nr:MAG: beta-ketoacyl synthase [Chitinophagaceae bacterium]
MFIRASASISPQQSFGASSLPQLPAAYTGNRLTCIEPDYKEWVDPKLIRRMSRIIKMGVATASLCLKNAGIPVPDAIVTGTAYGCLEDTGIFLNRMIEFNEEMLNPTAFIQSTHNTVGAQIALSVKCYGYNNTFVHRGFSFESALLDGILLLKDKEASNVLIGATDELTNISYNILNRFGLYRSETALQADANKTLVDQPGQGTLAGEGSAFFLITDQASEDNVATLDAIHSFYKPAGNIVVSAEINAFLAAQSLSVTDIDLVIDGRNGDLANDAVYTHLANDLFASASMRSYKQYCGEYPTSSSFALWYAISLLKGGRPGDDPSMIDQSAADDQSKSHQPAAHDQSIGVRAPAYGQSIDQAAKAADSPRKILIYNHYKNIHHSLFLVSAC